MLTRLRNFFLIYRSLAGDPRTPARTKLLPWISLIYLFFPLDIIPDFIPLLGQADDLTVIIVLLWLAFSAVSKPLYREHQKKVYNDVIDVTPAGNGK